MLIDKEYYQSEFGYLLVLDDELFLKNQRIKYLDSIKNLTYPDMVIKKTKKENKD